jgi:hypothetical protein
MKPTTTCAALAAFAAIALVLPTAARAADIGVTFTETRVGTGPETLSVTGTPATIAGTTDNWTITLPAINTAAAVAAGNLPMSWVEANGDPGLNILNSVPGVADEITLMSESTATVTATCGTTPAPLAEGITCFIGTDTADNSYFGTVVENVTAVPAPLIGHGLLAFLAVGGILFGAKFWQSSNNRRSLGTA